MKPILHKVQKKISETASDFSYRLEQVKYAQKLPALSPVDRQIVDEINHEGVAVRSLDDLCFSSTPSLQEASNRLIQNLGKSAFANPEEIEYEEGFRHCAPVNPSRIAKEYPALYLWGLDDRILNIVENCIGLPIAYHGVIARKEANDGKQVGTRLWHRDQDDRNIIRISIYLNDVGIEDSPFEYIPKSLTPSMRSFKASNYVIDDDAMAAAVSPCQWKACTGLAGTIIFAAAAQVFHHGKVPRSNRQRIAASYHYTSRQPTNPQLCKTFSFKSGIPFMDHPFTARQREVLWEYQNLLPQRKQEKAYCHS
ncbi:hypothetical protein [Leptolyngbya sp. FACHB-711]|uniref:hypothetical protein n=1 Tax=Leptolyngbya sp. FACHB-711 TaxID=2692813 RepID=UPI0016855279|nr:hypothetical protein [Leptolyngbya sp. FACHB-711]MBD2025452.1 hypothetical protein [Leptolyngbya sp. FACHB-711]